MHGTETMAGPECIFCRIVAGDIPCAKVHEDEACLAFMDTGPLAEGHVLLIPKVHAVTIDELSVADAAAMLANLPALAKAVCAVTGCEGLNILQNNGAAAHQVVRHVHFHLIPRNVGDAFDFNWPAGEYSQGRMDELAQAIGQNLRGG